MRRPERPWLAGRGGGCLTRRSTSSTGYNLLHAGGFARRRASSSTGSPTSSPSAARAASSSSTARGADAEIGPLSVRYAPDADTLLERLAAEHRDRERVCLVSSDSAVRGTSGQEVRKLTSRAFLDDLEHVEHREPAAFRVGERLDDETRARLERLRRGRTALTCCKFASELVTRAGPCYVSAST